MMKDPKSPLGGNPEHKMSEKKPSQYGHKGNDEGYERSGCDAPKGHPGFLGSKRKNSKG